MGGVYPKPPPAPEFDLKKSRFDLSTFEGRWMQFQQSTDFRTLFLSTDTINENLQVLETYKRNLATGVVQNRDENSKNSNKSGTSNYSNDELWNARRIVEATCHPESNEQIFAPVRILFFAFNVLRYR